MRSRLEAEFDRWLLTLFSSYIKHPFASHMEAFWHHVWSIKKGARPKAFIACWFRGGTKSTSAELAVCALAAMRKRRYALYISATQEQADDHVANIAAMLESPRFAVFYPKVASRRLSKYGHSRGWRRNRLRTASGFTIDAIGLDTAARGVKMEEDRPDVMILDDIDEEHDDKRAVDKKVRSLTRKLLPAGSDDVAVLGIQNLVHKDSIFMSLVKGTADFLTDRIVSGPVPAVNNMQVEQITDKAGDSSWVITEGDPTWSGMSLEVAEENINTWGLSAFLNEAQHKVTPPPGGMFNHLKFVQVEYAWAIQRIERMVVWIDPAITDTDRSDSHAIQVDGLGTDGKVYRFYSWEDRTSPEDSIKRGLIKAHEYKADGIGIETDQGGDAWISVYNAALKLAEDELGLEEGSLRIPLKTAKAGSVGSKTHRASQMLFDYETDQIRHVKGTHEILEAALNRFPRTKPFDLTDASYWSWRDLRDLDMLEEEDDVVEDEEPRVAISPY